MCRIALLNYWGFFLKFFAYCHLLLLDNWGASRYLWSRQTKRPHHAAMGLSWVTLLCTVGHILHSLLGQKIPSLSGEWGQRQHRGFSLRAQQSPAETTLESSQGPLKTNSAASFCPWTPHWPQECGLGREEKKKHSEILFSGLLCFRFLGGSGYPANSSMPGSWRQTARVLLA